MTLILQIVPCVLTEETDKSSKTKRDIQGLQHSSTRITWLCRQTGKHKNRHLSKYVLKSTTCWKFKPVPLLYYHLNIIIIHYYHINNYCETLIFSCSVCTSGIMSLRHNKKYEAFTFVNDWIVQLITCTIEVYIM